LIIQVTPSYWGRGYIPPCGVQVFGRPLRLNESDFRFGSYFRRALRRMEKTPYFWSTQKNPINDRIRFWTRLHGRRTSELDGWYIRRLTESTWNQVVHISKKCNRSTKDLARAGRGNGGRQSTKRYRAKRAESARARRRQSRRADKAKVRQPDPVDSERTRAAWGSFSDFDLKSSRNVRDQPKRSTLERRVPFQLPVKPPPLWGDAQYPVRRGNDSDVSSLRLPQTLDTRPRSSPTALDLLRNVVRPAERRTEPALERLAAMTAGGEHFRRQLALSEKKCYICDTRYARTREVLACEESHKNLPSVKDEDIA